MNDCLAFFLLAALVAVTAGLSYECEYVDENFYLTDVDLVEECFNSYTLDQGVIDTILDNLKIIEDIYPYVDIARNPPRDPPLYFKVMNYHSDLEELEEELMNSDGIISKVVRPVKAFVNGFRDGHFTLDISEGSLSPNIFASVFCVLPFEVFLEDNKGERRVFISLNEWTERFLPKKSYEIYSKYEKGIYVSSVDGKDAFKFFSEFFGNYNPMKSKQGRLMLSLMMLRNVIGFPLLDYPTKNIFNEFTLTYSDGDSLQFSLGFMNLQNAGNLLSARDSRMGMHKPEHFVNYVPPEREKEILDLLVHFNEHKRPAKRESIGEDIQCGMIGNMNYLSVPTFLPQDEESFVYALGDCITDFDKNDKPITVILKQNNGGSVLLEKLLEFLLMPESDVRSLEAFRKTEINRYILEKDFRSLFSNISNNCDVVSSDEEIEQFWSQEDRDDLGNGVIHTRTKKMYVLYRDILSQFENRTLKKNIRKPTDIIVATDGYCFSACSIFVDKCITTGSGVVTGFGVSSPGDEKFVAGQCPSIVIETNNYFPQIAEDNEDYGVSSRTTFTESYIISKHMQEKIPLDYSILRVDNHCGYNNSFDPDIEQLLKHTTAVHKEFKTKCNPDNQRLLLVDDKCRVNDPNALRSGYACGSDGKWDKTRCKISTCKAGYVVDFESNTCVPNCCDPRPSPVSSSMPSLEAANSLHPMTTICVAFVIPFFIIRLAFIH